MNGKKLKKFEENKVVPKKISQPAFDSDDEDLQER